MNKTITKTIFGLSEKVYSSMLSVFSKQPKVKKIVIFGSRAMGNFYEGSDIDLAIFTEENFCTKDRYKILRDVDNLKLLYKIDFIFYHSLKHKDLKKHIDRVGKIFYTRCLENATTY